MKATSRRRSAAKGRSSDRFSWHILKSETARFVVFCTFVFVLFLTGGGSRGDIVSLVVLRPFAFIIAGYALMLASAADLRKVRTPLVLLGLLTLLMLVQLVPLPQDLWIKLPERALYAQIAADAGLGEMSRPLTLSSSRTLNSLMSLCVPLATVLIIAVQGEQARDRILTVLAIAAVVSALWAIAQVAGPDRGPLYTYALTNNGFPVGPFSNRNHLALLLAILLVLTGYFARRWILDGTMRPFFAAVMGGGALVVLALVLVAGSRAGLVLAITALAMAAWLALGGYRQAHGNPSRKAKLVIFAAVSVVVVSLIGMTLANSQALTLERLSTNDAFTDVRAERLPLIVQMLRQHWLFGIGFGAFESVFKGYETVDVLTPFIFNQAHNDWLQFVIEGGLPAAALLAFAVVWLVRQVLRVARSPKLHFNASGFVACSILVLTGLASVVDYPLRTPIMMFICATAFTLLAQRAASYKR